MDNICNLFSNNFIANNILNNNGENLLIKDLNNDSMLEVVENISAHYLFNKEQILIITDSFKSDIVNKELFKSLNSRLIDFQKDFTIKEIVTNLISKLDDKTGKTIISKIDLINRDILKKVDILNKVNLIFYKNENNKISLIDKYIYTKNTNYYDEEFNKYYIRFRIKKPLYKYSYKDISIACKSIIYSEVYKHYIKYRRFIDNDIFNSLRHPLNFTLLERALNKINKLITIDLENYNLINTIYTEDFTYEFVNNNDIDTNFILSLSNIVNLKYNYSLVNISKKKKWFNFFSKNKNINEEYNTKLFNDYQKDIYTEYINNLNTINTLKDKLIFFKDILTEESYNEIITSLVNKNDLTENLEFYRKLIKTAFDTKESFDIINNLSDIEKDILNYCYNDLEKKSEINILINLIPDFKLYLEIEEEEFKYYNYIDSYKEYDCILNDIYDDIDKKNYLISNSINNIWDNQLREGSSILINNIDSISNKALNNLIPCVISNYSEDIVEKLYSENFFFKKVILILNKTNDQLFIDKLKKISENVVVFSNFNDTFNNFKIINSLTFDDLKKTNKKYDEICSRIEGYLFRKYPLIRINTRYQFIEIINSNEKILIEVSPELENTSNKIIEDLIIYDYYKSNNIKFYRLWYRDWWLDKFKELKNIEKLIDNI